MPKVVIPFGGGLHTRAFPQDINEQECFTGYNFDLDPQNRTFRPRDGFDLIGTAPNAGEIRGFISLLKSDGTVSMLIQAGDTVYEWDGATTFTSKGTVASTAQLRGRIEHNWQLDDKVIITDLNLQQNVMEWDGTTLQNITFYSNPSTTWTGDFRARYCAIVDERVIFANIYDNGSTYPHMIVGSQRADFSLISISDRASSSLAESDPFMLIQPDYRYINGMVEAFGILVTSSRKGSMWQLTGGSASDFAFTQLHPHSGASGDEAVTFVGNDIAFGREGRIESVISTNKYGDVDVDDLSLAIFDSIETYNGWTIVYNSRKQRIYCFPTDQSECWVFHKAMAATQLSPWSKWTTLHNIAFKPTAVMNCYDPADSLEYVFMGDSSGNIYRLEGATAGDPSQDIICNRRSALFKVSGIDQQLYEVSGYIEYKTNQAIDVTIKLIFQGETIYRSEITTTIPAADIGAVWGGDYYFGGGVYFGNIINLLKREKITIPGQGEMFQLEVETTTTNDFEIVEVGLEFKATPEI
jgi:hypothetical protein